MNVVSYVPCSDAEVRIVERPEGWAVTVNGQEMAARRAFPEAYAAAIDLAQGVEDHEVEYRPLRVERAD